MREPGRLLTLRVRDSKDLELLADLLDYSYGSNIFKILHLMFPNEFLKFLDVFQEDELKMPSAQTVFRRIEYIHIYRDSKILSMEQLCNKYRRRRQTIENILEAVASELAKEDSDI